MSHEPFWLRLNSVNNHLVQTVWDCKTPHMFPRDLQCLPAMPAVPPLSRVSRPHHPLHANPLPVKSGKRKLFFVRFWVLVRQMNLSIVL